MVFIKMPFDCQNMDCSICFCVFSPSFSLSRSSSITMRYSGQLDGSCKWGQDLPICYQCLELKNTCLDVHQSEDLCLITPFPPPFWWKSSKCEMKGPNGLSECFSQPCWKWLRHWLFSISSEKAIPKVGVNLQLSNGLIHIILYATLNYSLPAVILEVWNRFLPKTLNRNDSERCRHESV